eukprot:TRINITY_DN1346_c0_g1_i1.p1 TRINITY_DN1346_c0_g1~~TRINITY_DN1346_c0_g1_i1.p1  ORF type:complete len:969 (+),score=241.85 TRINITY_DN1346_c0_g1_i1:320-3226(+)
MGDYEETCEDAEVQAWLEGALQERLVTTDLFEAMKDGTLLCRLMLALQPNLDFAYHRTPESEEEYLFNISVFIGRCEAIAVEVYFNPEDIIYRTNLQGVLSTVCTYGEEEMKQIVAKRRNNGTLTKQAGLKNMKNLKHLMNDDSPLPSPRDDEPETPEPPPPEETPEEKREKQKKKQTMVLAELFETEKSFVADLELLVKKYLYPVLEQSILTQEECNDIFINIRDIWVANRKLLKDLETKRNKAPLTQYVPISEIFISKAPTLLVEPYSVYCCNHGPSLEAVEKLKKKRKEFQEFLYNVQMTDPEVRGLDLISYLVKPVQRICKYPLLFRELLKQAPEGDDDIPQIKEACVALEKVVEKVNANKKISESQLKIAEVEKTLLLGQEEFTFIAPGRTFIREGDIKKLHMSKGEVLRHAILLSNLFILCKAVASKGYQFSLVAPLERVTLRDLPDSQIMKNALEFNVANPEGSKKIFLMFLKPEDKTTWVKEMSAAIAETTQKKDTKLSSGTSFDLTDNDQLRLFDIRIKISGIENMNLLKIGRKVLKEGEINLRHKTNFDPCYLYLFSDMVVITKFVYKDAKKKNRYSFKAAIPFESLIITEVRDSSELKNAFHLTHKEKKKIYVIAVNQLEEKRDWMKDIRANNIYKFCRNVDDELAEIFTEKELKSQQEKITMTSMMDKLKGTSGIKKPYTGSLSHSQPMTSVSPKISLKQIEGLKLKSVEGGSSHSVKSGSTGTSKDKKKERGTLSGLFGSEKKDKDKDKDKRGSFIAPAGGSMMKIPPPNFKKPPPPNRPASSLSLDINRPSPKAFVKPASQVVDSDSSSSPPTNPQSKLRPTPKATPKVALDMTTASGTALRKLAPPPVTGIPKSPLNRRAPAPAAAVEEAPPPPPPPMPKVRPLPAPGSGPKAAPGAPGGGRPLPSPGGPTPGAPAPPPMPKGRPLPARGGAPLHSSGPPQPGRPLPAPRGGQ